MKISAHTGTWGLMWQSILSLPLCFAVKSQHNVGPRCDRSSGHQCRFGAYCVDTHTSRGAECHCDRLSCLLDQRDKYSGYSICGSDEKTYISQCHMDFESCIQQKKITLYYNGPCTSKSVGLLSSFFFIFLNANQNSEKSKHRKELRPRSLKVYFCVGRKNFSNIKFMIFWQGLLHGSCF